MLNKYMLVCVVVFMCGCQTVDPHTGQTKTGNAGIYAAVGAVSGALAGAAANGKNGALAGAILGGAAGGGYGYYVDKQEAVLRERLKSTGVKVIRDGSKINLVMPANITFSSGSPNVDSSFYPVLRSVSDVIKEFQKSKVLVVGHTDSVGGVADNQILSESRARSVAGFFLSQGVNTGRVQALGAGLNNPIASNDTVEGRAENRRVEVVLVPPQPQPLVYQ